MKQLIWLVRIVCAALLLGFFAGCEAPPPPPRVKAPLTEEEKQVAAAKKREQEEAQKLKDEAEARHEADAKRTKLFRPHYAKFNALYDKITANGRRIQPTQEEGYFMEKVVAFDAETRVQGHRDKIPAGLEAATPAEVGTVMFVKRAKVQLGTYNNGAPAMIMRDTILLFDWRKQEIISIREIDGKQPPDLIHTTGGAEVGPLPTLEVKKYLKGLKRYTRQTSTAGK